MSIDSIERGPGKKPTPCSPGLRPTALLHRAADEGRILVTIDTDLGALIYVRGMPHRGLIR